MQGARGDERTGSARGRPRNLSQLIIDAVALQISSHEIAPGTKLPTEAAIMARYGVSRTVVREALRGLQAAGLVATQHGVGTFVLAPGDSLGFRLEGGLDGDLGELLQVMELRISFETESAGLAAMRRDASDLAAMRAALAGFDGALASGDDSVSPDFRFHLAIARATRNRHIEALFRHLGTALIPRTRVDSAALSGEGRLAYLHRVNREHDDLYQAILRQDPDAARAAMRTHLGNSRERLRQAHQRAGAATEQAPL